MTVLVLLLSLILESSFALLPIMCSDNYYANAMSSQNLVRKLLENYDRDMVPIGSDGSAVKCEVEVTIQEISGLSVDRGQFAIDVWYSQIWLDSALKFDHLDPCRTNLSLDFTVLDRLWTPNVCFANSYQSKIHISPSPNVLIMIFPNGTAWVNYRVQVEGPCLIDLSGFPMDQPECELIFESYSYNSAEVKINWLPDAPVTFIKPYDKYKIPEFYLTNHTTLARVLPYTAGMWDQLVVKFRFRRMLGYYVFQSFIPTALCVILSWVAFFLPTEAVRARISLGMMSTSALIFTFGNITAAGLPKSGSMRALDVWIFSCMVFNFLSLVELAMASYADKWAAAREKPADLQDVSSSVTAVLEGELRLLLDKNPYSRGKHYSTLMTRSKHEKARKFGYVIDSCAIRLFPTAFIIFNLIFWYKYLILKPNSVKNVEL